MYVYCDNLIPVLTLSCPALYHCPRTSFAISSARMMRVRTVLSKSTSTDCSNQRGYGMQEYVSTFLHLSLERSDLSDCYTKRIVAHTSSFHTHASHRCNEQAGYCIAHFTRAQTA